ncbi:MAG: HlyD family efflux transporter periplasmic adaptor subunit [Dactylosporangium sp.]|nr:efflux RND transporter periplasmic adaptor subunit [Dactylosporangium sp.]NNJ63676.1 HlyD family efflux transporter periplasmic adaptor subunit [Dactylosporangium sp.]
MRVRLTNPLRMPRRRLVRWLAGGAAVLVAASTGVVLGTGSDDGSGTTITTAKVQRGTVSSTVSAAGTAQPLASRALSFSMSGTVTELNVTAGDVVDADAVLAKIDDTDAQSAVEDAQAQVDNAEDAVERAQASLSSGTSDAGYRLAASASPSTPASPAPSETAPTPAATTTTDAGGGDEGTGGGTTGGGTTSGDNAPGGGQTTGGSGSGRDSSDDSLLSAQQQLNNARRTLQQQRAKLAGTVITAPISGKILSVGGMIGSTVSQSSAGFIVLAGTNDVAVAAEFTEAEVARIAIGQSARITLPNLPNQEFTGTVFQIDPAGTISSELVRYPAVIAFDEIPDILLFGQTANAAVITESAAEVLYVPATAVSDRNGSTGTVTVRVRSRDERRTVRIGLRGDVYTEIQSGLAEGDEVLVVSR